jgi:hypothetical protein
MNIQVSMAAIPKKHMPITDHADAVLVTAYRPDPNRWINWRERRME